MKEIRDRLAVVTSVANRKVTTGFEVFDAELGFVQLRKSLELIAFGSLIANKEKYSAVYANFASHWKAKAMLDTIAKLNPDFYPVPLQMPRLLETGVKHCDRVSDGFLTKSEFESLYDNSCEVLHVQNPFTTKEAVVRLGYSVADWVLRIQRLLALHLIRLVDGTVWIIQIPHNGPVKGYNADPHDIASTR